MRLQINIVRISTLFDWIIVKEIIFEFTTSLVSNCEIHGIHDWFVINWNNSPKKKKIFDNFHNNKRWNDQEKLFTVFDGITASKSYDQHDPERSPMCGIMDDFFWFKDNSDGQ
jgi:hypothetical protein